MERADRTIVPAVENFSKRSRFLFFESEKLKAWTSFFYTKPQSKMITIKVLKNFTAMQRAQGTIHFAVQKRQKFTNPSFPEPQGMVLARGVSGCLLDTTFEIWSPCFICHLHVNVGEQFGHPVSLFSSKF